MEKMPRKKALEEEVSRACERILKTGSGDCFLFDTMF